MGKLAAFPEPDRHLHPLVGMIEFNPSHLPGGANTKGPSEHLIFQLHSSLSLCTWSRQTLKGNRARPEHPAKLPFEGKGPCTGHDGDRRSGKRSLCRCPPPENANRYREYRKPVPTYSS